MDMDITDAQEIELLEPPKELTVEQKMEMSLEDIIWYEKELQKASSLTDIGTSAAEPNNKNMYVRPRRHSIGHTRPPHSVQFQRQLQQPIAMRAPIPATGAKHYMTGAGLAGPPYPISLYRKHVQKAVRTLLSNRSRSNYRNRPYNMGNRAPGVVSNNDSAASYDGNGNEMTDMSDISFSVKNDLAVSIRNELAVSNQNGHQINSMMTMIDTLNSDGSNNLELPVRASMEPDFVRVPKHFFMGTKIVVSRHTIKNKLNYFIQSKIKEFSGESRVRNHRDMNVFVQPNTTAMSMNDRFTFNG